MRTRMRVQCTKCSAYVAESSAEQHWRTLLGRPSQRHLSRKKLPLARNVVRGDLQVICRRATNSGPWDVDLDEIRTAVHLRYSSITFAVKLIPWWLLQLLTIPFLNMVTISDLFYDNGIQTWFRKSRSNLFTALAKESPSSSKRTGRVGQGRPIFHVSVSESSILLPVQLQTHQVTPS